MFKRMLGIIVAIVTGVCGLFMCGSAKYIEWQGILGQNLGQFWWGIGLFVIGIIIVCLGYTISILLTETGKIDDKYKEAIKKAKEISDKIDTL